MLKQQSGDYWKQVILTIFNIVAGTASIVGLIVMFRSDADKTAEYLFYQTLFVEVALLTLVCYLGLSLKDKVTIEKSRDRLSDKLKRVNHALQRLHEVPHSCRNVLVSIDKSGENKMGIEWFQLQLNAMAEVFNDLTGYQCALCIKSLCNNDADVMTLCRDSVSQSKRKTHDRQSRSVASNTAFHSILTHNEQYYGNNDLVSLGKSYRNDTASWQELYNSTIAVPIQFMEDDERAVLGFLCVDAAEKNVFELEPHAYLLGIAADSLYLPMEQYRCKLSKQPVKQANKKG